MGGSELHRPGKKLIEAAAWWVRGGGEYDQARADLRAFGASDEEIEQQLGPEEDKDFNVWPENWPAVHAFLLVQTQWNVGMGGPTGLDYVRVKAGLEMAGVAVTPELFTNLRILESAALERMADSRKVKERAKK